ncbi:predicted protein [Naegleria gruberi]|uniref:Predicted protein n=1 Tax=Naegleria gruberi TaxID=5762 RepID=D2V9J7_NAEGR|nr:uncharacterized protein NAEGRDRAFT_65467 [Naegleria gruberi]EFC46600.1 predicted protein [Naegleria gruberi]|eukprot:XP_002679344.1 predicted protein [Naegleria gruberi strain NEG-M]
MGTNYPEDYSQQHHITTINQQQELATNNMEETSLPLKENSKRKYCVIGGSGFLGSHLVMTLLRRGHAVNLTVRNLGKVENYEFIKKAACQEGLDDNLQFFQADLAKDGSFYNAFLDCDGVFATACPLDDALTRNSSDPKSELFDPIVNGVKNVVRECVKIRKEQNERNDSRRLKRLIFTSSITAVSTDALWDYKSKSWHYFDEAEWNDKASLTQCTYAYCKTMSEREAFELLKGEFSNTQLEIAAVLPSTMFGPSIGIRKNIGMQPIISSIVDIPAHVRLFCPSVDVRDVALAHCLVMEKTSKPVNDQSNGFYIDHDYLASNQERVIVHNNTICTRDICQAISKYPQALQILEKKKLKLPTQIPFLENTIGDKILLLGAYLTGPKPQYDLLRGMVGKELHFSNNYVKGKYGLEFTDLDQTILETVMHILEHDMHKL